MSKVLSVLRLKGRLTRLPYALIAIPLLLVVIFGRGFAYIAPLVMARFGAGLQDVGGLSVVFPMLDLLLLPLFIISFSRLHDLHLTGWLALPIMAYLVLKFYIMLAHASLFLSLSFIIWMQFALLWIVILIVLALILVPGRTASIAADSQL